MEKVVPKKNDQEIQVFKTSEIDLFIIETRAKQMFNNMIDPLYKQIEGEREERAKVEVMADKF